jgi:hypothetical protein
MGLSRGCPPMALRGPLRGISIPRVKFRLPAIAPLTGPLGRILKPTAQIVRRNLVEASAQGSQFGAGPISLSLLVSVTVACPLSL